MDKKKEIGLRIRTMRKSRDMTQENLGKALGQSASSITMYETGRREPDFETLEALADIFNVPLASLVSEESTNPSLVDAAPTEDLRVLFADLTKLSPDQQKQARQLFRAAFMLTNPELFTEGDDDQ